MDLHDRSLIESRKRAWEQHRDATQAFSSPKRPASQFRMSPWPGLLGGFHEFQEFSKGDYLNEMWTSHPGSYDIDPFIPADEEENPVTQDVWLNTYGPLGQSSIVGDGRLVFKYYGIDVLRRVARDDPFGTVEHVKDDEVFVKGFRMKLRDHTYREELLGYLTQDYHVAATDQPPYGGLATCLTLADLKTHIATYVMRLRQLRDTVPATKAENFELADHQRTIYGWSRPTTMNGGSQAAPGVEALLALCVGPQDLYDLFRPMGTCFTGKNKIDAENDMVTLLCGGKGKMRLSSMDDSLCKRGMSAPFSLWLVYRQKCVDTVHSANRHLDHYPDVDLMITNLPMRAFFRQFMANVGYASYSSREDPHEITPFIFLQVAIVVSRSYPRLNDETDVHVTLAEQCRPIKLFPSRLRSS